MVSSMWRSWRQNSDLDDYGNDDVNDPVPVIRPATNTNSSPGVRTIVQEVPVIRSATNADSTPGYRSEVAVPVIRPATNTASGSALRSVVKSVPVIRPSTNADPAPGYRSEVAVPVIRPATNADPAPGFRSVVDLDDQVPVIRPATYAGLATKPRAVIDPDESYPGSGDIVKISSDSPQFAGIRVTIRQGARAEEDPPVIRPAINPAQISPALTIFRPRQSELIDATE